MKDTLTTLSCLSTLSALSFALRGSSGVAAGVAEVGNVRKLYISITDEEAD
jgi:hypothetical protein